MNKNLVAFLILITSTTATSETSFKNQQARMLQHVDQRLTALTEARTCITKATSEVALKSCYEAVLSSLKSPLSRREILRERKRAEWQKRRSQK